MFLWTKSFGVSYHSNKISSAVHLQGAIYFFLLYENKINFFSSVTVKKEGWQEQRIRKESICRADKELVSGCRYPVRKRGIVKISQVY